MNLRLRQFTTIARLTTLESIRQPICLLLLTTCVVSISLLPFLITHTLEDTGKLVRDSALAVHLVVGLLLGSYAACTALVREIHRGTVSSILSKPVGRGVFFLAKFSGVAVLMILFSLGATIATMLSTRVANNLDHQLLTDWWVAAPLLAAPVIAYAYGALANYRRQRPFNSAAFAQILILLVLTLAWAALRNPGAEGSGLRGALPLEVLPASVLVTMAILVLTAIAVSLATRLEVMPTISACSIILMVGLISDYVLGRPAAAGNRVAAVFYTLVPNWQHFWVVDALSGGGTIAPAYTFHTGLYAALYIAGVLCLGAMAFRSMEMR